VVEYEITPDRAHLFASRVYGDGVRLQWISRIGSTYSVEWTPDIAIGPWQLLTRKLGNGGDVSIFDYPGGGSRFYRVVVEP
jgi:hypothetical protein